MNMELDDLAACRRTLEGRWFELQRALRREVGYAPRRGGWILIVTVAAAAFSLARGTSRHRGELP
jgi:hypothetical protein